LEDINEDEPEGQDNKKRGWFTAWFARADKPKSKEDKQHDATSND